jgi:hypothetical protein
MDSLVPASVSSPARQLQPAMPATARVIQTVIIQTPSAKSTLRDSPDSVWRTWSATLNGGFLGAYAADLFRSFSFTKSPIGSARYILTDRDEIQVPVGMKHISEAMKRNDVCAISKCLSNGQPVAN